MRCQITIPIFNMDLKAQKTKLYGFANEMVNYLHPYWTSLWFKLVLNTEIWKRKVMQIIRGLHVQSEPGNPLCSLNPLWENKKKKKKKKKLAGSAVGALTPTHSWSTSRADSLTYTNTRRSKIILFLNIKCPAAKIYSFVIFFPQWILFDCFNR